MGHVALRVYAQPGGGTCVDKRTGMCPYYRVLETEEWQEPICTLFPTQHEPFVRLMPIDETGVPQRADD